MSDIWRSLWRVSAVMRVAAAAPSGLRRIGLRPVAVFRLAAGVMLAWGLLQATVQAGQEPLKQDSRVTDDTLLRSLDAAPAKTVDAPPAKTKDDAAPAADDNEHTISRVATGKLVYVGKRAISVETESTDAASTEMLLPIDGETKVERLTSLANLNQGDTVKVRYQQTYKDGEDGQRIVLGTVATSVALVQRAPEGALRSTEN